MMPLAAAVITRTPSGEFRTRVLIVDEEPLVLWSLAAGLRLPRFDVVTASSSVEALALAREPLQPDVVLLGLSLNNTDPGALLDELRLAAPKCRFLLMATAAHDMPVLFRDVLIIQKPFDLGEVVRLIDATVIAQGSV